MLAALPDNLAGCRDRALLLVGFAGGSAAPSWPRSTSSTSAKRRKGSSSASRARRRIPEGQGSSVALPFASSAATCPVRSCRAWLAASGITGGPVFRAIDRHGRLGAAASIRARSPAILQRAARAAGLDATLYAGHSLRAGFCTQAYLNGAPGTRHHAPDPT